ncbi:hypothetical protein SDJN02_07465 [Cucurbita argyrosperma subsp. argyrosperma]|nr:hypothetical protein SDJN02_07465 [Cucurbita argyrosperma subsp. argyrosperma]
MATVGHTRPTGWFNQKIVDPLLQILQRGAEPKQLAFSAALGITLGLFPICGVTVFLCGLAIAFLGSLCHAPTVMLANFVATPLELSLVVPFLRFGEALSGRPSFPLTPDALKKLLGWAVAAPLILGIGYLLFLPCFKILVRKFSPAASPHSQSDVKMKTRDD